MPDGRIVTKETLEVAKRKLRKRMTDLKNFFIEVPRKETAANLDFMIDRIRKAVPGARWF